MNAVLAGRNLTLRIAHAAFVRSANRGHHVNGMAVRRVAMRSRLKEQRVYDGALLTVCRKSSRCQWGVCE